MSGGQIAILWWTRLAILLCALSACAQKGDVAVVVNAANHTDGVTLSELRKIFVGERHSWEVGMRIKLIVRRPGAHERTVLLKLMAMSESEYGEYWIGQVFRGEVDAEPLSLPSLALEEKALSVFPGGIGFVDAQNVKPEMKVLRVNGHLPGEPGYPLR
jgi:ABC-type phosphate transport system substrate-binding protein